MQQRTGDKITVHFMENVGGLNLSDSTFLVKDNQSTGGYNYEYVQTGGIQKSLAPSRLNSSADAQLRTLGLALRHTKDGAKSIIRAADRKLQLTNLVGTFTNLTQDTAAAPSNFLAADSTQQVATAMFTSPTTDVLWAAGGGMDNLYGVYSDSKVTANGSAAPTGSISATETGSSSGTWAAAGTYYYAVGKRKGSTGALSNAALDVSVTLSSTLNTVTIDLSGLTNVDTTRDDKIYLYRSALNGADAFTTGSIVAELDPTTTSYEDTGSSLADAENIPRAGNTLLDNSPLAGGTYQSVVLWKRRLVTAAESTVYISDLNKPESWPLTNSIVVPSGGKITALATVSFSPNAASTDEFLVVFKETEVWVITGDTHLDWSLKFVDYAGTLGQPLVVSANGYLYWVDNRGVYLWDGLGKPIYLSRPIEALWGVDGDLDRAKLYLGSGVFLKRQNCVLWYLSSVTLGEQVLVLKLDLRLTLPQINGTLAARMIDGCFLLGKVANPVYAAESFIFPTSASQEDVLITGDDAGYTYRQFYSTTGVGADDYDFTYDTKYLDMGSPSTTKQYYQVIAWVENIGDWELYLDYWTNYRTAEDDKHTVGAVVNDNTQGSSALWDIGKWDQASWDGFTARPRRVVFNLSAAPYNNNQGEVLKLRFRNQSSDQPILIYGFSVVYAELSQRPV